MAVAGGSAMTGPVAILFDDEAARWQAVQARDAAADGAFVYGVASTGVYCYPSCAARPKRRGNVSFHPDAQAAERAGFRPCRRCRPDLPPRGQREADLVAAACRTIDAADSPPPLDTLAHQAGLSRFHFHRLFRRLVGVTPRDYGAAARMRRVQRELHGGAPVTAALYQAGFQSSGRFYEAADAMLGMTASRYRAGGAGEIIRHATGVSSLGVVLVAASARGICAILLGADGEELGADLHARFPRAELRAAEPDFAALVARVVALVDDPAGDHAVGLPLDIRGTALQCLVWQALRDIPAGTTLSYGELAARLGKPRAVRAVASACGANPLAVAVPCHRVVAANGGLAGYRWGLERKRALLAREAENSR
jgi:AraC family transcriptional regulator of adaptative response/methylated-DNA-[protein]-cysteine methyltransferase